MPFRHVVTDGDTITKLAFQYGFFVDTIWENAANASLKRQRVNMDILMPGDEVVIPDKRIRQETRGIDERHKFVRRGTPAVFRLQLFDLEEPRVHQEFTLTLDGSTIIKGTTDDKGCLEAFVSPDTREGQLVIGPDQHRILIRFGTLDPLTETTGVQKRLNNLGFHCGEPDGELNEATRAALSAFQIRMGLPVTGEPDANTREKLAGINDEIKNFPAEPRVV